MPPSPSTRRRRAASTRPCVRCATGPTGRSCLPSRLSAWSCSDCTDCARPAGAKCETGRGRRGGGAAVQHDDWFLTAGQRENPNTRLDSRRGTADAWSEGNLVTPLVHGVSYFDTLLGCIAGLDAGDTLFFTDWRGYPDEVLVDAGPTVAATLCAAAARGVVVNGLVWR